MACDNTEAGGYIPQYKIDPLFNLIRDTMYLYGFDFLYLGTDWHVNSQSCSAKSDAAANSIKLVHRSGTYKDLNIWLFESYANYGRGVATPPVLNPTPQDIALDGIMLHREMLVGAAPPWEDGDTIIHEIGHWLYLYHTFQGGCDTSTGGDFVSDTPYHEVGDVGTCPTSPVNTCPGLPGNDPINNFMSYYSDGCINHFTPGQVARMHSTWTNMRDGL